VLAALKRDGREETRRRGPHRTLKEVDLNRIWAFHDGMDRGQVQMAQIARGVGYTVEELRKL
jgi:predicted RNA binding protein YcfA (HicA-like mRNA interferase family)